MAFGFGGKKSNEEKEVSGAVIKIHYDGEIHEFTMNSSEYILEKALDEGIDLPYSCQSGLCTSCRCKKISGEMTMEEPDGLTEQEIEEGYVLICVGRPVSDVVELEVD